MITTLFISVALIGQSAESSNANSGSAAPVEKNIIYQKETTVDLSGSNVEGENQLPPAFFLMKNNTPNAESLLAQRLKFGLKNYNQAGF
jgi:hypothetical protein